MGGESQVCLQGSPWRALLKCLCLPGTYLSCIAGHLAGGEEGRYKLGFQTYLILGGDTDTNSAKVHKEYESIRGRKLDVNMNETFYNRILTGPMKKSLQIM